MPTAATVAIAAPNRAAADAGARLGGEGGNAVDAAVAAMLVAMVNEPGIVSLAGGAFLTVAPPDGGPPVTVDGYVEMPGRGLGPEAFGRGLREVVTTYGGRTAMTIGHGSVAVPGALAALEAAHTRWGRAPWAVVLAPAIETAREGFALSAASDHYLEHARELVFGHDRATRAALHHDDGRPVRAGERLTIPDLAGFLELVATEGAQALHRGPVAAELAAAMAEHGGLVTEADLAAYRPVLRPALEVEVAGWRLATNPPPAIGGPVLAAMLLLLLDGSGHDGSGHDGSGHVGFGYDGSGDGGQRGGLARLVAVQRAVLAHRALELDVAGDRAVAGQALLDGVLAGGQSWLVGAGSTAHVSVVGADGAACAVTASSGYGSGISVRGTGLWLNNCLGEHELNRGGPHNLAPGQRLASNMAPTVARGPRGEVLAIGSPGADRITTALAQVLTAFLRDGDDLQEAIDRPRLHVSRSPDGAEVIECEQGLDHDLAPGGEPDGELGFGLPLRVQPARSMYFGGVGAALFADGRLVGAADPRRAGAVALG